MNRMRMFAVTVAAACLFAVLFACSNNGNSGPAPSSPTSGTPAPSVVSPESAPPSSPAQDEQLAEPEAGKIPTSQVTALRLADFQSGWAGGEGWIARTDDAGKTWSTQWNEPYTVRQLFALNGQEAWATIDTGDAQSLRLLQTTNGGKTWTEAGTAPNREFLHFVSSKEAFSGSARTTDGGKSWTELKTPAGVLGAPYFHDRNNGWAVTSAEGRFSIQRTTDGGQTWRSVLKRDTVAPVTGTVIRSAGKDDAWVVLVGDSGMSQTSYSLFHTADGGKTWIPVLANNQAGSGPAPGFQMDEKKVPSNAGSSPGTLYVVDPKTAFMGGVCSACDLPNTMGKTIDGGKTWTNLSAEFAGYGTQLIAAADAGHIWWINNDQTEPSVLYTSSDGGLHWNTAHTFAKSPAGQ